MSEIVWLTLLLAFFHKGDTETSCDVFEENVLKCNFSINVNATQTDFSVYFQLNNINEELLVDCVWLNHNLSCLKMKNVDIKPQVSETAEISIPTRLVTANGTYTCNLEGLEHKQGKPCGFYEKKEKIQNNQLNGSIVKNHPNDKAPDNYILWIAGCVFGAVTLCILGLINMVNCRHVKKRQRNTEVRQKKTEEDSHPSTCTDDENDPTKSDQCSKQMNRQNI